MSGIAPFMLAASNVRAARVNTQRIVEALIIAILTSAITAGATVWATQQVLETKLSYVSAQVDQNKIDIKENRERIITHVITEK